MLPLVYLKSEQDAEEMLENENREEEQQQQQTTTTTKNSFGNRDGTQLVKRLPNAHKALGNVGVETHTCDPRVKGGGINSSSHLWHIASARPVWTT